MWLYCVWFYRKIRITISPSEILLLQILYPVHASCIIIYNVFIDDKGVKVITFLAVFNSKLSGFFQWTIVELFPHQFLVNFCLYAFFALWIQPTGCFVYGKRLIFSSITGPYFQGLFWFESLHCLICGFVLVNFLIPVIFLSHLCLPKFSFK